MEELVRATRPRLLAAVRPVAGADDAEDAVQAAFLTLLRRGAPPASVEAWLLAAAVRLAYRRKAKQRREEEIARRLGLARQEGASADELDAERIRLEVARLPAAYRDAVILHHLNGLETAEVARLLDVDPTTVRTRLHRARALLKSRLGPRLAHGAFLLPWLLRDTGAHVMGGVVMSRKVGALLVLLSLMLVGGVLRWSNVDPAPERRAPAESDEPFVADDPGALPDEAEARHPIAGAGVVFGRLVRGLPPVPVPGTVTVGNATGGAGADGRFRVAGLPRATALDLVAQSPGLLAATLPGLRIGPVGERDVGDVVLGKDCPLDVEVKDFRAKAVEGAQVSLHRPPQGGDDPFEAGTRPAAQAGGATDARGRATVRPVPPGWWQVLVRAEGYAPRAVLVTVREELEREIVRVVLPSGHELSGRVFDSEGRLVSGAFVLAEAAGEVTARAPTDSEGRYRLASLAPATWKLSVLLGRERRTKGGSVAVPLVERFDVHLPGGAALRGHVTDGDTRTPVAGAVVTATFYTEGDGQTGVSRTTSDADGAWALEDVPPGILFENSLVAEKEGYLRFPDPMTDTQAVRADLRAGETVEREIVLHGGGAVRGRVVDESGEPVAHARVTLSTMGWSPTAVTAEDGSYRLSPLQPGRGLLFASAQGYHMPGYPERSWPQVDFPPACTVDVPERGEVEKDLVLAPLATAEGLVVDGEGRPVAGAAIHTGGESPESATGADGAFRTLVRPGTAIVLEARGLFGTRGRSAPFAAQSGETVKGIRIELQPGASLSGTVRLAEGAKPVSPELKLVTGRWEEERRWDHAHLLARARAVPIESDGTFRIEGLDPLAYTLLGRAEGTGRVVVFAPELKPGEARDDVEILLPVGKSIAGRVLDDQGKGIAGAVVSVAFLPQGPEVWSAGEEFEATAVTDLEGRFVQGGLGSGRHAVTARAAGYLERSVDTLAGAADVEVRLTTGLTIGGVVVDAATGEPIAGAYVNSQSQVSTPRFMNNQQATSGPDGRFEIRRLLPGTYMLWAGVRDAPGGGFETWQKSGVAAGTAGVRVELKRGLAISGRILEADGRPAKAGAVAWAERHATDGPRAAATARTDGQGNFRIAGLPAGTYKLTINPPMTGAVGILTSADGIAAGADDVTVRLPEAATISGRIVVDGGELDRLANAFLRVVPAGAAGEWNEGTHAWVREDGSFESAPVAKGQSYDLIPEQFRGVVGARVRNVMAGSRDVVVRLVPARSIQGRVVDADGAPVPAAVPVRAEALDAEDVEALRVLGRAPGDDWTGTKAAAETRADGTFVLDGLGAFRFRLVAGGSNTDYVETAHPDPVPAGTTGLDVRVPKGQPVGGRLLDGKGKPLPGVRVSVAGAKARTNTGDDGSFVLRGIKEATVRLNARIGGKDIDLGTHPVPSRDLVLTAGE